MAPQTLINSSKLFYSYLSTILDFLVVCLDFAGVNCFVFEISYTIGNGARQNCWLDFMLSLRLGSL